MVGLGFAAGWLVSSSLQGSGPADLAFTPAGVLSDNDAIRIARQEIPSGGKPRVISVELRVASKQLAWRVTFVGVCDAAVGMSVTSTGCHAREDVDVNAITGEPLGTTVKSLRT